MPPAPGPLVVYAGRSEALVGPIVAQFEQATGIDVEVRYGTDAALLAALQEEGARSPADVFWANSSGTLVAATMANLLGELPDSLRAVPAAFVPASGRWVPVTIRFRTLALRRGADTTAVPTSVLDLPQATALRGRIGWTPAYASFQDFVTALRVRHGDDSTRTWLEGMKALRPRAYASNTPMLEALEAGEIDVALTNHYYVLRILQGTGETAARADAPVSIRPFATGDDGNLALVTGAGVLPTSTRHETALRFLHFLLSSEAQAHAASVNYEYPVVRDTPLPAFLMPLDRALALSPALDFERLGDLDGTLRLLREAELL